MASHTILSTSLSRLFTRRHQLRTIRKLENFLQEERSSLLRQREELEAFQDILVLPDNTIPANWIARQWKQVIDAPKEKAWPYAASLVRCLQLQTCLAKLSENREEQASLAQQRLQLHESSPFFDNLSLQLDLKLERTPLGARIRGQAQEKGQRDNSIGHVNDAIDAAKEALGLLASMTPALGASTAKAPSPYLLGTLHIDVVDADLAACRLHRHQCILWDDKVESRMTIAHSFYEKFAENLHKEGDFSSNIKLVTDNQTKLRKQLRNLLDLRQSMRKADFAFESGIKNFNEPSLC